MEIIEFSSYLVLLKMLLLTTLFTDRVTSIFWAEKSRTIVLIFVGSDLKRKMVKIILDPRPGLVIKLSQEVAGNLGVGHGHRDL